MDSREVMYLYQMDKFTAIVPHCIPIISLIRYNVYHLYRKKLPIKFFFPSLQNEEQLKPVFEGVGTPLFNH